VRLVHAHGGPIACGVHRDDATERAWERAKHDGWVTVRQADELAIRLLGLHPMLVWGEEWLVAS